MAEQLFHIFFFVEFLANLEFYKLVEQVHSGLIENVHKDSSKGFKYVIDYCHRSEGRSSIMRFIPAYLAGVRSRPDT